jgi:alpha-beta hydrolase superfamily lysophospholipase
VPGAGRFGLDFLLVHEQVARRTTSLLYDRAGTGWSDDVALPRSTDEVTDELRDLLGVLAVPGPYLLVGHSLGGAYVQRYAQRSPARWPGCCCWTRCTRTGTTTCRSTSRSQRTCRRTPRCQTCPRQLLDQLHAMLRDTLAGFPEPLAATIVAKHGSPERLPTGFREGLNAFTVIEELRRGGPRPDVPTTILSASGVDAQQTLFATEDQLREQIHGSQRLYTAIAEAAPQGTHRTVADASHTTLPMARPDAVADAMIDLLRRAPRPQPHADPNPTPTPRSAHRHDRARSRRND